MRNNVGPVTNPVAVPEPGPVTLLLNTLEDGILIILIRLLVIEIVESELTEPAPAGRAPLEILPDGKTTFRPIIQACTTEYLVGQVQTVP